MSHHARPTVFRLLLSALGLVLALSQPPTHAQSIEVPEQAAPIMALDDIRIGMKGYGMTVFHGTEVEPFNLEVVSIIPASSPQHSVIWVRCTDDRMVLSGPVQGMSGSPIYLWEAGEAQELGKGGKLIGAFAFGFTESKTCMVGVQPIAYMRESATRVDREAGQARRGSQSSGRQTVQLLNNLSKVPGYDEAPALTRTRIDAIRALMSKLSGRQAVVSGNNNDSAVTPGPYGAAGAQRLMLPMSVGSVRNAEALAPLLEPMGFIPVASEAVSVSGRPPHGIDPAQVTIKPGSVLAVPLAYGDMDLSATGTVTDILPGGEVLGFGHPMFGMGEANVPMATGYVHFVMPRNTISFKRSNSLIPVGTLVRDESAAVVGIDEVRYTAAPVDVNVTMPGQDTLSYHYEVVNEPSLSGTLVANVILSSIDAIHSLPVENTMRFKADMRFEGDRELKLDTLITGGSAINAIFEVLPVVAVLAQNPYEDLDVESIKVDVDIEHGVRMSNLMGGRLDRSEVAPGETVKVHLQLQHYGEGQEHRTVSFKVPEDLAEGDYQLMFSGVDAYGMMKLSSQPQLMVTRDIDELIEYIQATMSFKTDALYAVIQLPEMELAVGRTELPDLPSSRAAILTSPTHTDAMPYMRMVEERYDSDSVILGQIGFTLNVRKR